MDTMEEINGGGEGDDDNIIEAQFGGGDPPWGLWAGIVLVILALFLIIRLGDTIFKRKEEEE